jgi:hypothetical protein
MSENIAELQVDSLQKRPLLKARKQASRSHRVAAHQVQATQFGEAPHGSHSQAHAIASCEPSYLPASKPNLHISFSSEPNVQEGIHICTTGLIIFVLVLAS